jgi:hypothetical protein
VKGAAQFVMAGQLRSNDYIHTVAQLVDGGKEYGDWSAFPGENMQRMAMFIFQMNIKSIFYPNKF